MQVTVSDGGNIIAVVDIYDVTAEGEYEPPVEMGMPKPKKLLSYAWFAHVMAPNVMPVVHFKPSDVVYLEEDTPFYQVAAKVLSEAFGKGGEDK